MKRYLIGFLKLFYPEVDEELPTFALVTIILLMVGVVAIAITYL